MKLIVIIFLAILSRSQSSQIYPNSNNYIFVESGEGFSTYLVADSKFTNLLKCQLKFEKTSESYDIEEAKIVTNFGTIEQFGDGVCGAVIRNVSKLSQGKWELVAVDDKLQRISGYINLQILDSSKKQQIKEFSGATGMQFTFSCDTDLISRSNGYYSPESKCEIKDLQTGKTEKKCSKQVFYPEYDKVDSYECSTAIKGSTNVIRKEIRVTSQFSLQTKKAIFEDNTNNSTVLSCKFPSAVSTCLAIHLKTNTIIHLQDNLVGERYSPYETNKQQGKCQLEIPMPLTEKETGTWKIVTRLSDQVRSYNYNYQYGQIVSEEIEQGCLFNVQSDGHEELKDLKERTSKPQIIKTVLKTVSIKCETAPYELKYCYLVSDTHQVTFNEMANFPLTKTVGSCIFHDISPGSWKCGFNAPNPNEPDLIQDILIKSFTAINLKAEIFVGSNDSLSLLCQTVIDTPIKSCIFFSPDGGIHHLSSSKNHDYFGRGLDFGDCGILLRNDNVKYGNWTCNVMIHPRQDYNNGQQIPQLSKSFDVYQVDINSDDIDQDQ